MLIFGLYRCSMFLIIKMMILIILCFLLLPNQTFAGAGNEVNGSAKKLYGIDIEKLKVRPKKIKKKIAVKKPTVTTYKLSVDANPKDSIIKIMNIRPKYFSGIKLKPGKYNILVKKSGYKTYRRWVEITDKDLTLKVTLKYSPPYKKSGGGWKRRQLNQDFFRLISKDTCAEKTAVDIVKRGIVKGKPGITKRNLKILSVIFKNCTLDSKDSKEEFCKNYQLKYIDRFCAGSDNKSVRCRFFKNNKRKICSDDFIK